MEQKLQMFENRLTKVFKRLQKIANKKNVSCYRIYDHDLPEFPFVLDVYDQVIFGSEYKRKHGMEDAEHDAWMDACQNTIKKITGIDSLFLKERKRIINRQDQYIKQETTKVEKIVQENGLSFIINLSDYLDAGLFLDHRDTRQWVRDIAQNKRVLNLFCYTGSFSVYAAAGGAAQVTSVDLSKTYTNWAKRNLQYNHLFDEAKTAIYQEDVMIWLKNYTDEPFDLVIVDPPSFSNSKRMKADFDIQRDHVKLLNAILQITQKDGQIIFSNNRRGFTLDEEAIRASQIKDITNRTTPFDFEGRLNRPCFLITK